MTASGGNLTYSLTGSTASFLGPINVSTGATLTMNGGTVNFGNAITAVTDTFTGALVLSTTNTSDRFNFNSLTPASPPSGSAFTGTIDVATTNVLITNSGSTNGATIAANIVLNSTSNGTNPGTFTTYLAGTSAGFGTTINGTISGNGNVDISNTPQGAGGGGTLTLGGMNTYLGSTSIDLSGNNTGTGGSVVLVNLPTVNGGNPYSVFPNTPLIFGTNGGSGLLNLNGTSINVASLSNSGSSSSDFITNNGSANSTITLSGTVSPSNKFGGTIEDGSKTIAVVFGAGNTATDTFSGINNYSGGTTINGGTLAIKQDSSLGGATGSLAINAGTLQLVSGSTAFSSSRPITLGSASSTIDVNGVSWTLANVTNSLTGIGSLNLNSTAGGGALILSTAANYAGSTVVNGGTLQVNAALSSTTYTIDGGTMTLGASNVVNPSTVVNISSGTLNFGGTNQTLSNITVSGGTVNYGTGTVTVTDPEWDAGSTNTSSNQLLSLDSLLVKGGTNTITGTNTGGAATVTVGSATGTLEFGGTGSPNITINSDNTTAGKLVLAGNVVVDSSVVQASITSAPASPSPPGGSNPGQVDLNGAVRSFTVNNTGAGTGLAVSAQIIDSVGGGGLTANGPGILNLSGENTYGGTTTVSSGTLLVTNAPGGSATGTSTVNVNGSAVLGGSGTISGAVSLGSLSGGTIDPSAGGSPTILTLGSLTLHGSSHFDISITSGATTNPSVGSNYDSVYVTGAAGATLNNANLVLNDLTYTSVKGQSFDILHLTGGGTISGIFDYNNVPLTNNSVFSGGGNLFQITYFPTNAPTDVILTAVPEPGTIVLFVLGSLGLWGMARRRRAARQSVV